MNFLTISMCLVFATLVYVRSEDTKEKIHLLAEECKTEVGATDDDVEAMFKHESAASKEAKCLRACMLQKSGIMNEAGKMVKDAAMGLIKAIAHDDAEKMEQADEILDACVGIEVDDEDHCEAAEQYLICVTDEAKAKGFSFDD